MNRHVNAIAGHLSLRPPQRQALEILDRITKLVPPKKAANPEVAPAAIRAKFPGVTDFERDFPSLCFALATGVGKSSRIKRAHAATWSLRWESSIRGIGGIGARIAAVPFIGCAPGWL
jgi:hypothetical protein